MATDSLNARGVKFTPLANDAAIAYFKSKIPAPSKGWDDWLAPVHAKSFTVAGAPSVEFASDMHAAVTKAIASGASLSDFRRDFDGIVDKYGWTYNGKRGWRTALIYNTNMRTAKMAAKWQTIQENKDVAPYLEYVAVGDSRTRPQHKAWSGTILHVDDAFWSTHYPPNGWNCRCTVMQMSSTTLKRQNKTVSTAPNIALEDRIVTSGKSAGEVTHGIPRGIDAGWDVNVGQAWVAPDVALGQKLARLPPEIAGYAYQNMVTKPFMTAVDGAWRVFVNQVAERGHAKNETQFVGFISHKVQQALVDKGEAITAKTAAINASRAASAKNNLPQLNTPNLTLDNLAMVAPDFKINHLAGMHKEGSLSQWSSEWVDRLPSLLHDYQAVLYDTDAQSLVYVTKENK